VESFDGLEFKLFEEADVELFAKMFRDAFDRDAQMRLGENGDPPRYEDGSFLRKWYAPNVGGAFAIHKGNVPIGGMSVYIKAEKK